MVSEKTATVVWGRSAGRCQYKGCNAPLIGDLISGKETPKFGFIAHIVAGKATGPRGDAIRSPQLADNPVNLMLLCGIHHKLIDVDDVENHPEERLIEMKTLHEQRIGIVTEIDADLSSHVLRYGAGIGHRESIVSFDHCSLAMLPGRFPADRQGIGIEILGSVQNDGDDTFWKTEPDNLRKRFSTQVQPRLEAREIKHLSVFALGPIPLLVELGHLLGDITPMNVFQLHREPKGWNWPKDGDHIKFNLTRPNLMGSKIALKLGLSATITDDRVLAAMGDDTSIWAIESERPHNDSMRHPEDLRQFRRHIRSILNEIKAFHGQDKEIHVISALPVSAAVELGRCWMPKADLPLVIYDHRPESSDAPKLRID